MDFGKFLFLYLLGQNVEYFIFQRILNAVSEGNSNLGDASAPRIISASKANNLSRELSRSDVHDTGIDEVHDEDILPKYAMKGQMEDEEDGEDEDTSMKTLAKDYPMKVLKSAGLDAED